MKEVDRKSEEVAVVLRISRLSSLSRFRCNRRMREMYSVRLKRL